jgi:hypothetical protein
MGEQNGSVDHKVMPSKPQEDRGGHSPRPVPADVDKILANLPKGPAPGARRAPPARATRTAERD